MKDRSRRSCGTTLLAALAVAACAPIAHPPDVGPAPIPPTPPPSPPPVGLPPIPAVDGPLTIAVMHPPPGTVRPSTDSVFIYGTVGTGRAALWINGHEVVVAPNGAFIAFLPRPVDDTFELEARTGPQRVETRLSYRPPAPTVTTPAPPTVEYPVPRAALITGGADTLATGSDVAIGRPTPTGTYRWFLPRGARLSITGERGAMVRARLDSSTEAWFPRDEVTFRDAPIAPSAVGNPTIAPAGTWSDVRIPVAAVPFRITATDSLLQVTLHGATTDFFRRESADGIVALIEMYPEGSDAATVRIHPVRSIWGYKVFYDVDGALVVRVRRGPWIDPESPLRGVRVVVDPGHPPGGTIGPTGLTEADANLAIALRLAERLRARGADVLLTRTTGQEMSLSARLDMAVAWDGDLLVSVHNNAFPEGVNPFVRNGTSTYYFHPFSADLARRMNDEIVTTTGIRDLGALSGNLALVRPSWMPAVLTESLFMPLPDQEAALRNSIFLDQLAAAHVRGLESFLRGRAGGSGGVGSASGSP